MTTVHAYCSACDTEIAVRIPPEGPDALRLEDLACPHGSLCGGPACVLETADGPLRDALEFLPGDGGGSPRTMAAAARLVEDGRRASLAREIRRWRVWWAGR